MSIHSLLALGMTFVFVLTLARMLIAAVERGVVKVTFAKPAASSAVVPYISRFAKLATVAANAAAPRVAAR